MIMAGGKGSRLGPLTLHRSKPAVPFAGKYRIIDFTLSNCVNSNIFDVLILTQYRPHSLNDHIGRGRPWDLDRSFTGGVQILQPFKGRLDTDWYSGTADAVARPGYGKLVADAIPIARIVASRKAAAALVDKVGFDN